MHHELPTPPKGIPVQHVGTEPGPDGLYRDCVLREPHNDLLGRPIYVALDSEGREIDRTVAVSPEQTEKVLTRLWDLVYRSRVRLLHILR